MGVAVALDPPGVVGLGVTVALGLLVGVALPEDGLVVGVAVAGLVVGVALPEEGLVVGVAVAGARPFT